MFSKKLGITCVLSVCAGPAMAADWQDPGQTFMWQGGYVGGSVWVPQRSLAHGATLTVSNSSLVIQLQRGRGVRGYPGELECAPEQQHVLGVEGDINWSGAKQSGYLGSYDEIFTNEMTWTGRSAAVLGSSTDRHCFMPLAAWRSRASTTAALTTMRLYEGPLWSSIATRVGFTLGAGVEMALHSGWSVKVEGLYMDFGSSTLPANPGTEADYDCGGCSTTVGNTVVVFRLGANKHF